MKNIHIGIRALGIAIGMAVFLSTGCSHKVEKPTPGSPAAQAEAGMRSQMADEFHHPNFGAANTKQ